MAAAAAVGMMVVVLEWRLWVSTWTCWSAYPFSCSYASTTTTSTTLTSVQTIYAQPALMPWAAVALAVAVAWMVPTVAAEVV